MWDANYLPVNNVYKCTIDRGVSVNSHCVDLMQIKVSLSYLLIPCSHYYTLRKKPFFLKLTQSHLGNPANTKHLYNIYTMLN